MPKRKKPTRKKPTTRKPARAKKVASKKSARAVSVLPFFNALSATLQVKLTEPTEKITERLMNQKAPPTARIASVALRPSVFEGNQMRDLTPEELERVAFDAKEIRIRDDKGVTTRRAPNGKRFTVRDLIAAIEATERETRGATDWFGGVDVHHVFFEGLHRQKDGSFAVYWGS